MNTLDRIVCNRCGQEHLGSEEWMQENIHPIQVMFGYTSEHDGIAWKFDLCEECLIEFCTTFKIPPEKKDIGLW
jgi:hypothetical protein